MEQKKYFFQKLTPVEDADISVYEEAIDYVFENTDITNVAISGAYSAGKSSVLESYKGKHKKLKFVHISLAHFRTSDEKPEENNVKESVLEGKILNQLIHQIPTERIPQTNFRIKKDTGKKGICLMTLLLCLLVGSITYLSLLSRISVFVNGLPDNVVKFVLSYLTGEYATILMAFVFIVSSVACIYNVIKIQRNKNVFHRISIQGNEIEIFESQENSYFDKYLNEVLYLFEQVDADVIVFEDMDRFNVNSIFERLREVNTLTNIQRRNKYNSKIRGKKVQYEPLRFFYLLRDDIFVTKDRTKFFDYIVPIVPVLDGSNSYDQFIKYFKNGNIFEKFDDSFLQRLSLYIDDMRVLKNVYNEFIVYMYRLDNTALDWNKMLAMIVYKNLFPKDFSNLQLAKGYVHELFEQKENIGKNVIEQLEEEKQQVSDTIDRIKQETLDSVQELQDAYQAKYDRLPKNYYGQHTRESEQRKASLEVEKNLRKSAMEDRGKGALSDYEEELLKVEHEITRVKTQPLKELITRDNADSVFMISSVNPIGEKEEYKEIKGSDYFELLKFLIRYGYIDETYNDYMTYFYEESLTANDKIFLRRITDKRGADYEYSLKEVKKVIASPILRVVDFGEEETLNFDLLCGILVNLGMPKYQEYLSTLINQLRDKKEVDFISKFYASDKFVNTFVVKLNEQWPEFFSYAVNNKAIPSEQIRKYSLDTLCLSDGSVVSQMNSDNSLSDYISDQDDYLDVKDLDLDKIISQFEILEVSFRTINFEKSNRALFDMVYENNFYDLTFENIELMLRTQYDITDSYDIAHKNYTLIQKRPDSPLLFYVDTNLQLYLEEVVVNCGEKIEDEESVALDIINNNLVDDDTKAQYIGFLITVMSDITKVDNSELWGLLLENGIVELSTSNAVNYFQRHGLDGILVKFINRMDTSIRFIGIEEEFGKDVSIKLFDDVSINNDIETDKYKKILNDLGYAFNKYDANAIAEEKIQVLIQNRILQMCEEGLNYIRNRYENLCMLFIECNFDEYLQLQTADIFSYDEAIQVLDLEVEDDKKIELLGYTKEAISVRQKILSSKLFVYILTHNFDKTDANYLYQNYSKYQEIERDTICQVAINQIDDIIENGIELDDNLLSDILVKSKLSKAVKIRLWAEAIPKLNEDSCKKHFDELGVSELKGIFTKRNTTSKSYAKNDEVKAILEALKKNTWIYDYYVSTNDNERYIVIKNKLKNKTPEFLD